MRGLVLQQVLGVDMLHIKHNIDGGIQNIVHAAVIAVPAVLRRRPDVAGGALGVVSHQQPRDEHGFDIRATGVAVGVFGIPGKVTTWVWTQTDV